MTDTFRPVPIIMGILNVTPDSFSDGGRFQTPECALIRARALVSEGADIIDVGAESSRPGTKPVSEEEEWRRLAPVLEALMQEKELPLISLDTHKPSIMLKAAALGVRMINDIKGGADDVTLQKLASYPDMQYLAMHMHGTPETMQTFPLKGEYAAKEVTNFFHKAHHRLLAAGFAKSSIWLDPGIGFGKTDSANIKLMAILKDWVTVYNVAVGISRKSFIGRTLNIQHPDERDGPSKMLELGLALIGVQMIRTHDVKTLRQLLRFFDKDD